jgi:plasmid maintenance system antidote protein VapI
MKEWRNRILALTVPGGLSINEVAAGMGVTPNAVRELAAGRTREPRANAAVGLLQLCSDHPELWRPAQDRDSQLPRDRAN